MLLMINNALFRELYLFFLMIRRPPRSTRTDTLFPYTTLFRSFEGFPESGWDKVMDINVKSPFFLTQALHGLLKAAGTHERPAKVINIGSIDGVRLNPWETYSYHASKAAILYLTKRLAARLVQDHVIVTAIAPGAFQSDIDRKSTRLKSSH